MSISVIPRWVLVLALGGALMLPLLGSYGLWDPAEIQHADAAQDIALNGGFADVTIDGKYSARPVLYVWLVAVGFKVFGVNELAGRLPLALCGMLALLLAYRAGRRLFNEGAGLAAALVVATTPAFLFQSRQLASDVAFMASLLAAVGGLAAFLWPADGRRSKLDLAIGSLGLIAGFLSQGLLIGTLFPLGAITLAVLLSWQTPNRVAASGIYEASGGPDLAEGATVGAALRSCATPLGAALLAVGAVIGLLLAVLEPTPYLIYGGELRRSVSPPTFETPFKELGFGFYPWFALLPIALAGCVISQRGAAADRSRDAFPKLLLVVLAAAAYILAALWAAYLGKIRYPALPWLGVAVGVLLYELWREGRAAHRFWAIVAAGFILVLQQDFFMAPEGLAFSHLTAGAKYPLELNIKLEMRLFGFTFALLAFLALDGAPRAITSEPRLRWIGSLLRGGKWLFNRLVSFVAAVGGAAGRRFWLAFACLALVFAGWCAFYLTPRLSLHLSNKALFETFHRCRSGSEKLGQYQTPGRGAAYYNNGQVEDVRDQAHLFRLMRGPERWFILIPASHLGAIDQAARQQSVTYHVLDDRSSRYLIISNKLAGACDRDHNPLRRYVLSKPPTPRRRVTANFENRVKLLGYDVPDVVSRGGKFTITLYFQVLDRMPPGYKLFIHFDQPAHRFHGDHEPLGGKFSTQYWLPGDYIVDPHSVDIPLITTPSGNYQIYAGFWLGENRLKIVDGPNDGVNRVPLGTLRVR